jgi:hypothetical protein
LIMSHVDIEKSKYWSSWQNKKNEKEISTKYFE